MFLRTTVGFLLAGCLSLAAFAQGYQIKRNVVYSEPDGQKLRLNLYLPDSEAATPRPAVLLIHGGAWASGTRYQLYWYGRQLAKHGYVAASLTYRMMPLHRFPACVYDCKAAVRWLRDHADEYNIDPDRIAALGNSAGGHLAAMLATTKEEDGLEGPTEDGAPSSAIQTAVVLYGVADMSYYRNASGYIRLAGLTSFFIQQFVGESPQQGVDPYDAASPVTYADQDTCPVLFIHGTKDNIVPYAQAVAFHDQLEDLGVPTQLISVPYGHVFDFLFPWARADVFEDILAFLESHLLQP